MMKPIPPGQAEWMVLHMVTGYLQLLLDNPEEAARLFPRALARFEFDVTQLRGTLEHLIDELETRAHNLRDAEEDYQAQMARLN